MNNEIQRKIVEVETNYQNIILKGLLTYWSKDYELCLTEPFEVSEVKHLMFAAPVRYVMQGEAPIKGMKDIDLSDIIEETLIRLYKSRHKAVNDDNILTKNIRIRYERKTNCSI